MHIFAADVLYSILQRNSTLINNYRFTVVAQHYGNAAVHPIKSCSATTSVTGSNSRREVALLPGKITCFWRHIILFNPAGRPAAAAAYNGEVSGGLSVQLAPPQRL